MNSKKIIAGVCALTVTGSAGFGDYERNPAGDMTLNVSAEVIEYEETIEEVVGEIFTNETTPASVFKYEENYNGEITITGLNEDQTVIYIPASIDGKPVKKIGDEAFRNCDCLDFVELPDTITAIGNMAFYGCEYLERINLPEGLISVGEYSFEGCSKLATISIPESLTDIGGQAFAGTPWLSERRTENPLVIVNGIVIDGLACKDSVIIPNGTKSISERAFNECTGIKDVVISDGVERIGKSAFFNCKYITSIEVPDTVTSIGQFAFAGCTALTVKGTAGSYVQNYAAEKNISFKVINESFEYDFNSDGDIIITGYSGTTAEVYIPSKIGNYKVAEIGDNAFYKCETLEYIKVPESIVSIGNSAFDYCINLSRVSLPSELLYIGYNAFSNCSSLKSIVVPLSKEYGNGLFSTCTSLSKVELPENMERIPDYMFSYCKNLTYVEFPPALQTIGDGAFMYCESLKNIRLPDGIKEICGYSFSRCLSLEEIKLPLSVTSINDNTFSIRSDNFKIQGYENSYAQTYALKNDIEFEVLKNIFEYEQNRSGGITITSYNGSDENLIIPSEIDGFKVTEIGSFAFQNCIPLTSVYIPEGVTSIAALAFNGCNNLDNIYIPKSVRSIGARAFRNTGWLAEKRKEKMFVMVNDLLIEARECKGEVEIPEGISVICDDAFALNDEITAVSIPYGVTDIGRSVFNSCLSLEAVKFPETLKNIGVQAFSGCYALDNVSIPESVETIGEWAFISCDNLKKVRINNADTVIGNEAIGYTFGSERKNDELVISGISKSFAYEYAEENDVSFESISGSLGSLIKYYIDESGVLTLAGEGKIPDYDSLRQPFVKNGNIKNVIIENGITEIGDFLFFGNSTIESVQLPFSLEVIGQSSLSGCTGLKSITIPFSVKIIELGAFQHCINLKSVLLSEGIEKLGGYVFADCQKLESVTIPDSVISVEERPFFRCDSLKKISVNETLVINDIPEGAELIVRSTGENPEFDFRPGIPVLEIARDVEGEPGETVSVGIYIRNFEGGSIDDIDLVLLLDRELKYIETKEPSKIAWRGKGVRFSEYGKFASQTMYWNLDKTITVEDDKELLTEVQLKIPEDAVPGTVYPVLFSVPSQPDDFESGKPYYLPWSFTSEEPKNFIRTNEPNKSTECAVMCGSVKVAGTAPVELPGEENTSDIFCDMDGNGVVNMNDFIHLMRYIAGLETLDNTDNCDMNSDGYINVADALLLRYYLSK